eukprot:353689-Chlamydomonas_euryale.AAC.2
MASSATGTTVTLAPEASAPGAAQAQTSTSAAQASKSTNADRRAAGKRPWGRALRGGCWVRQPTPTPRSTGNAWHSMSRRCWHAWHGCAWHHNARYGMAPHGMA